MVQGAEGTGAGAGGAGQVAGRARGRARLQLPLPVLTWREIAGLRVAGLHGRGLGWLQAPAVAGGPKGKAFIGSSEQKDSLGSNRIWVLWTESPYGAFPFPQVVAHGPLSLTLS